MNDAIVVEMMRVLESIEGKIDEQKKALQDHMRTEEADLRALQDGITALHRAFPDGDLAGHHMYHSSLISRNQYIAQLCKDASKELAKYGLVGLVGWIGYHLWLAFLQGPK